MTKAKFNLSEINWAKKILSQPAYIMPVGKNSHELANDVMARAMDRMVLENPVRVNPETNVLEFTA